MSSRLADIFEDKILIEKIKKRLPYLCQLAEIECSRARIPGMQVGSLRETILVALLIYKFGEDVVKTDFPITSPEVDAELFGKPISIKTITAKGKGFSGVKLSWTVDTAMARQFLEAYQPKCDLLFMRIVWNAVGALYYIPLEIQQKVLKEIGREKYIKLPKPGTNPRGVEIYKEALIQLVQDSETKTIDIFWQKSHIQYDPYKRWVDYWSEE